jgi:heptosyltransferase-1
VNENNAKRIIVYRTGHLGDTICAIPAFRLIRNFFPKAELTLLCDRPLRGKVAVSDVIGNMKLFQNILTYVSNRKLLTVWDMAKAIRSTGPDIVIMLPQGREGMETIQRKKDFFRRCGVVDVRGHNFPVLRNSWQPNEANRLVQMLHSVGVRGPKPAYDLKTDNALQSTVKAKLHTAGVSAGQPYLLFCGGGKAPTQRWSLERYANVLKTVTDRFPLDVVAVGSREECKDYKGGMLAIFPRLRFPEPFSLPELIELSRGALAYFGNDTGPMHVAAAVNRPVAAVISARNSPGSWDPDVEPHITFRNRTECEDCFLHECLRERHRCLTGVTEKMVLSGLLPFLDSLSTEEEANKQGIRETPHS